MTELFLNVMNRSISAGWLVLAVLVLRFVLKSGPQWIRVLLWGMVAVRLLCPFSIESAWSLIPSVETIPPEVLSGPSFDIQTGIDPVDSRVNAYLGDHYFEGVTVPNHSGLRVVVILAVIWVFGILFLVFYTARSDWKLRQQVSTAILLRDNILQSEKVTVPFVLGVIRPKIYLPFQMDSQDLEYVVAHEQAHIHRKDHWWKPLGFLLLTIHWFNPLLWIAYVLLCRDIELACDEKVIKELGNEQRADYMQALLACSVNRRMLAAYPLAFGEIGVKERVKSVMNYKKPAFWMIILAVISCILVAVCFLTNPITWNDCFVLTDSEGPADTNKLSYDIQLGNRVMSGEIYAEQWIDGRCVQSAPVVMTQYVDSIDISMRERREGSAVIGTDVQIETNQYGGSLLTYFEHPETHHVFGWSFTGYEWNEKIQLAPDKEVILAAMAFDTGNGVRVFDCETLIAEPERLQNADNMIVIRAVFSSDPLGVTGDDEAPSPVVVLTLNDVITLSQKGYDLTWADFEQYDYIETGSGLYIREYKINDIFELWIGGAGLDRDPMYIYLTLADDFDTKTDIRAGAVTDFISEYAPVSTEKWDEHPMAVANGG